MKEKLYIIGAGSVGGHIALNIDGYSNEFEVGGFFDDDPDKIGKQLFGYIVLGKMSEVLTLRNANVVIGISFPNSKKKILEKINQNHSLQFPALVHDHAWISADTKIGKGCVIYPGNSINYGCVISEFTVLNMNCALGHHTTVGKCSSFAPGVSTGGHTVIGEFVDVGIGVSTIQNIHIGDNAVIGGQSMVTKNVQSNAKVVGVPAKPIR